MNYEDYHNTPYLYLTQLNSEIGHIYGNAGPPALITEWQGNHSQFLSLFFARKHALFLTVCFPKNIIFKIIKDF